MAEWIIDRDQYDGKPRYYTCPICRYTHDDFIDHVSENNVCPNCKNKIGDTDNIILRDHLLVIAGARAAYMDCAGAIDIDNTVQGEEDLGKFITHIVDKYIVMDRDMNFDEYIESNLVLGYSKDSHLMFPKRYSEEVREIVRRRIEQLKGESDV